MIYYTCIYSLFSRFIAFVFSCSDLRVMDTEYSIGIVDVQLALCISYAIYCICKVRM